MAAQTKRGDDYTVARRYLKDEDRFAETHDPEALARQVPKEMKHVRKEPASKKPASKESERDSD